RDALPNVGPEMPAGQGRLTRTGDCNATTGTSTCRRRRARRLARYCPRGDSYTQRATGPLLSSVQHHREVRIMKRVRRLALPPSAAVRAVGVTAAMTASPSAAAAVVTRVSITNSGGPDPVQS